MDYGKVSPLQIRRIDALGSFVEVMATGLAIDKVLLNFVSYDKTKPSSQRMTANVSFYMDVLRAKALSDRIMNGRMARLWKKSKDAAAASNKKYPAPVFTEQGGTPAERAHREDGKALSRTLTLAPGSKKPWVLTAESGPGVPGPNGLLIVPDYGYSKPIKNPEQIIRIAMENDKMEEFAQALNAAYQTWIMAKFVPLIQPEMATKQEEWRKRMGYRSGGKSDAVSYGEAPAIPENLPEPEATEEDYRFGADDFVNESACYEE